jgi:hypothetical protein
VTTQSITLNDDTSGLSNGNSDGILDAGETHEISMTFINTGNLSASSPTGKLRVLSPWVTVVDSTYSLSSISAGTTRTSTLQVAFRVAANTPDGHGLAAALRDVERCEQLDGHREPRRARAAPAADAVESRRFGAGQATATASSRRARISISSRPSRTTAPRRRRLERRARRAPTPTS